MWFFHKWQNISITHEMQFWNNVSELQSYCSGQIIISYDEHLSHSNLNELNAYYLLRPNCHMSKINNISQNDKKNS